MDEESALMIKLELKLKFEFKFKSKIGWQVSKLANQLYRLHFLKHLTHTHIKSYNIMSLRHNHKLPFFSLVCFGLV